MRASTTTPGRASASPAVRFLRWTLASSPLLLAAAGIAGAQGTLDDYRRAATIGQRYAGLTVGITDGVNWIGDSNRFWYRVSVPGGHRFVVVDADAWTRRAAFDHDRLAASLSTAAGASYSGVTLPFSTFTFGTDLQTLEADAGAARWRCTLTDYACTRAGAASGDDAVRGPGRGGPGVAGQPGGPAAGGFRAGGANDSVRVSPDGKWEALILNSNVALRPVTAPAETRAQAPGTPGRQGGRGMQAAPPPPPIRLSFDGADGNAYQLQSIQWAPDSRRLVAYRRKAGHNRIVHFVRSSPTDQLQPRHETTASLAQGNPNANYRKPGDLLDVDQPVLFDVASRKQVVVDDALFPNPYQLTRAAWRADGRAFTFEYNQRGHQVYRVIEVDGTTGRARALISEEPRTFFAYRAPTPGLSDAGKNWRHDLADGKEILWMSERDGWNHLYLYDGATGRVKNQVTKGPWVVRWVDSVDAAKRQIYFRAVGMNRDQDPYFTHHYRIDFDGTGLVAYTEGDGVHDVAWSPDRKYYVDTWSRVDMPPVVELRRASDRRMLPLEKGDMSAAVAAGFRAPEVFTAKARDGTTDIWGIIVRPTTVDPTRKYPVIESIYAGPQGSFTPKTWGGGQNFASTAELGFVVVQLDGMGTNNRSKAFHDVAWRNLKDAGFPDRILWHKAVNAKYPYYDISRVGLYGGSAGGQNTLGGLLFHPEFYTAGFASSGSHDNRMDKIWWNEQWMGELGPHYAASSNVDNAYRLRGKLFLAVGELDTNVDPASTMQVVDALIRAGKDFELLVVPNGGHGATGPDGARRRNDFFVRHLLGVAPPDWNAGVTLDAAPPARSAGRSGPPE
jgi:dipeptidyl aminopeptidase/acylaminoacyl peptidase